MDNDFSPISSARRIDSQYDITKDLSGSQSTPVPSKAIRSKFSQFFVNGKCNYCDYLPKTFLSSNIKRHIKLRYPAVFQSESPKCYLCIICFVLHMSSAAHWYTKESSFMAWAKYKKFRSVSDSFTLTLSLDPVFWKMVFTTDFSNKYKMEKKYDVNICIPTHQRGKIGVLSITGNRTCVNSCARWICDMEDDYFKALHIPSLPVEIWVLIFQLLPYSTLQSCLFVNSFFYSVVQTHFKNKAFPLKPPVFIRSQGSVYQVDFEYQEKRNKYEKSLLKRVYDTDPALVQKYYLKTGVKEMEHILLKMKKCEPDYPKPMRKRCSNCRSTAHFAEQCKKPLNYGRCVWCGLRHKGDCPSKTRTFKQHNLFD